MSLNRDSLDKGKVVETVERLCLRISERFSDSGLLKVCQDLSLIAQSNERDLKFISRPNWLIRCLVLLLVALILGGFLFAVYNLELKKEFDPSKINLSQSIQLLDAGTNDLVMIGAAIIFLISMETRTKRSRIIQALNRLRSIAHVIDMHQLTKDPSVILTNVQRTAHSPERSMTVDQLARYLEYCSEMLSLTSKIGYLYVQDFSDSHSVTAVNDLESLTTGLSRKIWQKIMLIHNQIDHPPA